MRKNILIVIQILLVSCLWASGRGETHEFLRVVTTTSIISDVVSNIGGDRIDLKGLISPGQDPHSYEPAPRDIAEVEDAEIMFVNGFDLEEGLLSIVETVNPGNVVEVSRQVNPLVSEAEEQDHSEEHHHESGDPHTWMSPLNVISWVDVITEALSNAEPLHSSYFHQNAEIYKKELLQLHEGIINSLEGIPLEERVLVTDHNLFGHFAREYHFRVIGTLLPGYSSSSESSARDTVRLLNLLKEQGVVAVFISESAGEAVKKLAATLSRESDHTIIVKELLTGSLRKSGQEGDSYIRFMEYNTKQIVSGLRP
jgi:ABC-type Zn uptake system ZnuABC Zn-binding protein ZnuA